MLLDFLPLLVLLLVLLVLLTSSIDFNLIKSKAFVSFLIGCSHVINVLTHRLERQRCFNYLFTGFTIIAACIAVILLCVYIVVIYLNTDGDFVNI